MVFRRVLYPFYLAGFAGLVAATFASYVLRELGHDEGMYLGASYLATEHELYRELAYFQAPNLPLLLSTFYSWADVSELLLWGRAVTFVHHAAMLTILGGMAWYYTRSATASFLFALWIGSNGFVFGAGYSIDATTFASAYLLGGLAALLRARERNWSRSWLSIAGFLTALAPGFKLSYLPLFACFVAVLARFAPRRALGPFLLGSLVGFGPILYMVADRPAVFWFDNVTWHRRLLAMNLETLGALEMLTGLATDTWYYLTRLTWLATFVILVPAATLLLLRERERLWSFDRALIGIVTAASLLTIAGLGAVRFWYLQPTAVAAALWLPTIYPQLRPGGRATLRLLLFAAAASSVGSQAAALRDTVDALDRDRWVPVRYARAGAEIARLARTGRAGSVATVGNPAIVYGVEADLPLTKSAATGAFVRVSSPLLEALSLGDDRIATYDSLSGRELEMIVATADYITPRRDVEPMRWCESELSDPRAGELVRAWCDAFSRRLVVGEGPARAVVLYR